MKHRVRTFIWRHWRGILSAVTVLALALLIVFIRDQLAETLNNLRNVNYWVLLLMIPMQVLNYDAYTRLYRTILRSMGMRVRYWFVYRTALELNFVNNVFPSGGISGVSYFGIRLREQGVRPATATLIQLIKYVLVFVSFQVLVAFGLLVLALEGRANSFMILVGGVLVTLAAVGTFVVAYVVGDKKRIKLASAFLARIVNRVIHFVRRGNPETISLHKVSHAMDEMNENYTFLKNNFRVLKTCFWIALLANATEVMTVYLVYIAFGEWVNIGAVILAYAVANFAGMISVLPGGIGVYEALMTAALSAGGIPAALSIPVIIMYRVLAISIQLIPGWLLYNNSLHRSRAT